MYILNKYSDYIGDYAPPPCSFNRVTMNFTVTSRGRQFDRLALMYLGDIEGMTPVVSLL